MSDAPKLKDYFTEDVMRSIGAQLAAHADGFDVDAFVTAVGGKITSRQPEWVRLLAAGATVDELARCRGKSVSAMLAELGELEVSGKVTRLPGQRYAVSAPLD